jgi:hypothetical protein
MKKFISSLGLALVIFTNAGVANDISMDRFLSGFENLISDLEGVGSSKPCGDNFVMVAANAQMKFGMSLANLGAPDVSNFTTEQMQEYLGLTQRMNQAQAALNQKQSRCI